MSQYNHQSSKLAGPALFFYAVILLIGTHVPGSTIQGSFSEHDKILHVTAYIVLALLAFNFISARSRGSLAGCILLLICLVVFATLDELTQIPVPGRFGDWRDWWADVAGISAAISFAASLSLYRRSRLSSLRRIAG